MGVWETFVSKGYDLLIKSEEKKERAVQEERAMEKLRKQPFFNEYAGCVLNEYEQEHLDTLREYLPECMVLLKSNGDFPLAEPCRLAAYGRGVRHTVKGGTGSGEVNSRFFVNAEQGLTHAGFEITTGEWLDAYDEVLEIAKERFTNYIKEIAKIEKISVIAAGMGAVMPEPEYRKIYDGDKKKAGKKSKKLGNKEEGDKEALSPLRIKYEADAAVYILSRVSGEGNDRKIIKGDYQLNDSEIKDILRCNKKYKKFMLVINAGGPVDLTPVMEVSNILVMSQLGVEAGRALADVLLGKSYPSGKLTTSWLTSSQAVQYPFGEKDDSVYEEGIYVGYRNTDRQPLFAFGHGLGYTQFSISAIKIDTPSPSKNAVSEDITISVSCTVRNTGSHAGKEVVQVYVSAPNGEDARLDKSYQVLAAFAKTKELAPGYTERLSLSFRLSDIASFDEENNEYLLEAGEYRILVGSSSQETVEAGKAINSESIHIPIKGNGGEKNVDIANSEGIKDSTTAQHHIAVNPYISRMTDEELALLCIGAFDPKGGIANVIGSAGIHVAGAAGETYVGAMDRGLNPLVMADGPAGLRIAKEYFIDKDGKPCAIGDVIPGFVSDFLPKAVVKAVNSMGKKPDKDMEILSQYTTALPIATAMAQSWNLDFARKCGDVVGAEMERFGVHLWLAPALNIHRNVLCGRNFEYYSEDPLVSGRFAAAVTKGVQAHPGCGVTIKHFLANNQETNRYCNNSVVSERALREIYLKGFEICIREANPYALMTSYNLVNGEHTSESRRFTTEILRDEWGYSGIVMTDWVTGGDLLSGSDCKYGHPEAWKVIAAGGQLFMPGGRKDYKNLLDAMKAGKVSRRHVEECASIMWKVSELLTGK